MDEKDPRPMDEQWQSQETSQLALRGALATIHKLQEMAQTLRDQLSATQEQNASLLSKVRELQSEKEALSLKLTASTDADALTALKKQFEREHQRKIEELWQDTIRKETLQQKNLREKELQLTKEFLEKEAAMRDDFRRRADEAKQALEKEMELRRQEDAEAETKRQALERELRAQWENRSRELMASVSQWDANRLNDRIAQEIAPMQQQLAYQSAEISRLRHDLMTKERAVDTQDHAYRKLRAKMADLLLRHRRMRQDAARVESLHKEEIQRFQENKKELQSLLVLLKEEVVRRVQQRQDALERRIQQMLAEDQTI